MKKDFYETLGVNKTASQADIKSAYRKMALKYHPDRNKEANAEEHFKEINEAYEVLSNQDKRSAYDNYGHAAFDPSNGGFGGHTYTQQNGPFNFTWQSSGGQGSNADFDFGGFSNPFDIFEQFFGGAAFNQSRSRQKQLTTYKIQISFLEAAHGCEKEVKIDGKNKSIKIPAGVDDGQKIRFSDFILYIDVLPDKIFKRDGNNVYVVQDISIKQAILGDTVVVPTLNEPLKVRIQPGTQPNTLVRLRGKGIRDVNGYGVGDFFIKLNILIPTSLSRHDRQLIDQLDV